MVTISITSRSKRGLGCGGAQNEANRRGKVIKNDKCMTKMEGNLECS